MSDVRRLTDSERKELTAVDFDLDAHPDLEHVVVTPRHAAGAQRALEGLQTAYPRLAGVIRAADAGLHPIELLNWLLLPCPDLDDDGVALSPFDWLRHTDRPLDPVLEMVSSLTEMP